MTNWLTKLCQMSRISARNAVEISTSIVRIFWSRISRTISTKRSRSTTLHQVFIKVWVCEWAIFFVDTDECWCSGEIFGVYPVVRCLRVAFGGPVSRCCFIQEAEYWNESQYRPSVFSRRKTNALISLPLYECNWKLRLYVETFCA